MLGKALILQTLLGGGAGGGGAKVILPETELVRGGMFNHFVINKLSNEPTDGAVYVVTYNGVAYDCTAAAFEMDGQSGLVLGNYGEMGLPGGNDDAPFVLAILPDGYDLNGDGTFIYYCLLSTFSEVDSVTLSIKEKGANAGGGIPQEDIDAAFAALAEKGVTIPDGATSADLDDLIASIVTGGGNGGGKTASGTITFDDITSLTNTKVMVEHNLGAVPLGFAFFSDATTLVTSDITIIAEVGTEDLYMSRYYNVNSDRKASKREGQVYNDFIKHATDTQMPICFASAYRTSGKVPAATTITWVAWA